MTYQTANWSRNQTGLKVADDLVVKSPNDCSTAESFTEFEKVGVIGKWNSVLPSTMS